MLRHHHSAARRTARRAARGLALAALLAAVPFAPAHAQLGRMIKRAAQGAVENAGGKAAGNAAANSVSGERAAIAISSENIDKLLTALNPMLTAARSYAAEKEKYAAAKATHDAARPLIERHKECRDSVKRLFPTDGMMPSPQMVDAMQRYTTSLQGLSERRAAAIQAGNAARAQLLVDSVAVLGEQMENVMVPPLKTCGAYVSSPPEPQQPKSPARLKVTVPDGMTPTQFGQLRERVAAWLLTNGKYKVSAEEQAALEARRADLDPFTPLFRGNALTWSNWSDVESH